MPIFGVVVAVVHAGRVLLTRRADIAVWRLPGGAVDPGESLAQAAIREVREETGVDVALTRLVGVYSRPRWRAGGGHEILFAARPTGGAVRPQPEEVLEAGYFAPEALPELLVPWHRQPIRDASAARPTGGGLAWTIEVAWPFAPDTTPRDAVRELADRTGLAGEALARSAAREFWPRVDPDGQRLEVGGPR